LLNHATKHTQQRYPSLRPTNKPMIKFFRKIRKKMLIENKFSKYLLYAIGEIVLVVIGILIALQINNWNAKQKIEKEEIGILYNLLESLNSAKEQSDIEIFNENKIRDKQVSIRLSQNLV